MTTATDQENEKELLKESVAELRRLYDAVARSFDHLRTKALALLAGEVAIVTFLFSGNSSSSGLMQQSPPIYGLVFYGLGIALLAFAFLMFLMVLSSITWKHPPEEKDVRNITARFNSNQVEFLHYLHNEYLEKIAYCTNKIGDKSSKFMRGLYALSIGIFLVILVKYGGGTLAL